MCVYLIAIDNRLRYPLASTRLTHHNTMKSNGIDGGRYLLAAFWRGRSGERWMSSFITCYNCPQINQIMNQWTKTKSTDLGRLISRRRVRSVRWNRWDADDSDGTDEMVGWSDYDWPLSTWHRLDLAIRLGSSPFLSPFTGLLQCDSGDSSSSFSSSSSCYPPPTHPAVGSNISSSSAVQQFLDSCSTVAGRMLVQLLSSLIMSWWGAKLWWSFWFLVWFDWVFWVFGFFGVRWGFGWCQRAPRGLIWGFGSRNSRDTFHPRRQEEYEDRRP